MRIGSFCVWFASWQDVRIARASPPVTARRPWPGIYNLIGVDLNDYHLVQFSIQSGPMDDGSAMQRFVMDLSDNPIPGSMADEFGFKEHAEILC